jgi:site-specific DNA recombinase
MMATAVVERVLIAETISAAMLRRKRTVSRRCSSM